MKLLKKALIMFAYLCGGKALNVRKKECPGGYRCRETAKEAMRFGTKEFSVYNTGVAAYAANIAADPTDNLANTTCEYVNDYKVVNAFGGAFITPSTAYCVSMLHINIKTMKLTRKHIDIYQ